MEQAEFVAERAALATRLFRDASFSAVEAMGSMTSLTEAYCRDRIDLRGDVVLWAGGSLGRREMLPNSDLDLFFIYPDGRQVAEPDQTVFVPGLDRYETGTTTLGALSRLAATCLIDLNQFVDGRPIGVPSSPASTAATKVVVGANTYDRQYANLVTEYFYFRHFDFPMKRTTYGANLKYSSGSARTTLFFNFVNRLLGGNPPATRGMGPEFLEGVRASEDVLGVPGPYRSLELIQLVKNAAISTSDASGDPRHRYVSRRSLDRIFELCAPRLRSLGARDGEDFHRRYRAARLEIESAADQAVERTVGAHRALPALEAICCSPPSSLTRIWREVLDVKPEDGGTVLSLGAWRAVTSAELTRADVSRMLQFLHDTPPLAADGALMAIGCAPVASDESLNQVIDLVKSRSAGSYVLKLVSRNPHASDAVRDRARSAYERAEFVRAVPSPVGSLARQRR
jgi:hypothetical protein